MEDEEVIGVQQISDPIQDIRRILKDYSPGPNIFIELQQNADDAAAKNLKFFVVEKSFPLPSQNKQSPALFEDSMNKQMGPALYVYDDGAFEQSNQEALLSIGAESKADDVSKTGLFGIGFCSVYHFTDVPSWLSKLGICYSDPLGKFLNPQNINLSRRKGLFIKAASIQKNKEQLQHFTRLAKFSFQDIRNIKGKLFRFPLRTKSVVEEFENKDERVINDHYLTYEKMKEWIYSYITQAAEKSVLFMKHIQGIEVYDWPEKSEEPQTIFNLKVILNQISQQIRYSPHQQLVDLFQAMKTQQNIEKYSQRFYTEFCLKVDCEYHYLRQKSSQIWFLNIATCGGQYIQKFQAKKKVQSKYRPLAGTAVNIQQKIDGQLFCMLPIPKKTGLPYHLNALFILPSNRNQVILEAQTDLENDDIIWNKWLINDLLFDSTEKMIDNQLIKQISKIDIFDFVPKIFKNSQKIPELLEFTLKVQKIFWQRNIFRAIKFSQNRDEVVQQQERFAGKDLCFFLEGKSYKEGLLPSHLGRQEPIHLQFLQKVELILSKCFQLQLASTKIPQDLIKEFSQNPEIQNSMNIFSPQFLSQKLAQAWKTPTGKKIIRNEFKDSKIMKILSDYCFQYFLENNCMAEAQSVPLFLTVSGKVVSLDEASNSYLVVKDDIKPQQLFTKSLDRFLDPLLKESLIITNSLALIEDGKLKNFNLEKLQSEHIPELTWEELGNEAKANPQALKVLPFKREEWYKIVYVLAHKNLQTFLNSQQMKALPLVPVFTLNMDVKIKWYGGQELSQQKSVNALQDAMSPHRFLQNRSQQISENVSIIRVEGDQNNQETPKYALIGDLPQMLVIGRPESDQLMFPKDIQEFLQCAVTEVYYHQQQESFENKVLATLYKEYDVIQHQRNFIEQIYKIRSLKPELFTDKNVDLMFYDYFMNQKRLFSVALSRDEKLREKFLKLPIWLNSEDQFIEIQDPKKTVKMDEKIPKEFNYIIKQENIIFLQPCPVDNKPLIESLEIKYQNFDELFYDKILKSYQNQSRIYKGLKAEPEKLAQLLNIQNAILFKFVDQLDTILRNSDLKIQVQDFFNKKVLYSEYDDAFYPIAQYVLKSESLLLSVLFNNKKEGNDGLIAWENQKVNFSRLKGFFKEMGMCCYDNLNRRLKPFSLYKKCADIFEKRVLNTQLDSVDLSKISEEFIDCISNELQNLDRDKELELQDILKNCAIFVNKNQNNTEIYNKKCNYFNKIPQKLIYVSHKQQLYKLDEIEVTTSESNSKWLTLFSSRPVHTNLKKQFYTYLTSNKLKIENETEAILKNMLQIANFYKRNPQMLHQNLEWLDDVQKESWRFLNAQVQNDSKQNTRAITDKIIKFLEQNEVIFVVNDLDELRTAPVQQRTAAVKFRSKTALSNQVQAQIEIFAKQNSQQRFCKLNQVMKQRKQLNSTWVCSPLLFFSEYLSKADSILKRLPDLAPAQIIARMDEYYNENKDRTLVDEDEVDGIQQTTNLLCKLSEKTAIQNKEKIFVCVGNQQNGWKMMPPTQTFVFDIGSLQKRIDATKIAIPCKGYEILQLLQIGCKPLSQFIEYRYISIVKEIQNDKALQWNEKLKSQAFFYGFNRILQDYYHKGEKSGEKITETEIDTIKNIRVIFVEQLVVRAILKGTGQDISPALEVEIPFIVNQRERKIIISQKGQRQDFQIAEFISISIYEILYAQYFRINEFQVLGKSSKLNLVLQCDLNDIQAVKDTLDNSGILDSPMEEQFLPKRQVMPSTGKAETYDTQINQDPPQQQDKQAPQAVTSDQKNSDQLKPIAPQNSQKQTNLKNDQSVFNVKKVGDNQAINEDSDTSSALGRQPQLTKIDDSTSEYGKKGFSLRKVEWNCQRGHSLTFLSKNQYTPEGWKSKFCAYGCSRLGYTNAMQCKICEDYYICQYCVYANIVKALLRENLQQIDLKMLQEFQKEAIYYFPIQCPEGHSIQLKQVKEIEYQYCNICFKENQNEQIYICQQDLCETHPYIICTECMKKADIFNKKLLQNYKPVIIEKTSKNSVESEGDKIEKIIQVREDISNIFELSDNAQQVQSFKIPYLHIIEKQCQLYEISKEKIQNEEEYIQVQLNEPLPGQIKFLINKQSHYAQDEHERRMRDVINLAMVIERLALEVFGRKNLQSYAIVLDRTKTIAFNMKGTGNIYFNAEYWNYSSNSKTIQTPEDRDIETFFFWYSTFCHELAHNTWEDHDEHHEFAMQMLLIQYIVPFKKLDTMKVKFIE